MTPYVLGFEAGWIGEDPGGPVAPWEPHGAVRGQAVSEGHLAAPRRWWRREREVRTRPEWAAGAEAAAGRGRRLVGPSGGTASGRRGMGQRVGATRPAGGGLRGHGWEPPCRCCWRRWQGPPGGEGTEGIGTPPGPAAGAVPGAGFGVGPSARPRGSPVQGLCSEEDRPRREEMLRECHPRVRQGLGQGRALEGSPRLPRLSGRSRERWGCRLPPPPTTHTLLERFQGAPGAAGGTGARATLGASDTEREAEGASVNTDPAGTPRLWREAAGNSREAGVTRGQPRQGPGLCGEQAPRGPRPGPPFLTQDRRVQVLAPRPATAAGHELAGGEAMTFCATCGPWASCWVARDVLLAGPERALCGGWPRWHRRRRLGLAASGPPAAAACPEGPAPPLRPGWWLPGDVSPTKAGPALPLFLAGASGPQPGATFPG